MLFIFSMEVLPCMLDNVVRFANDGAFADAAERYILINALNVIPPKRIVIPISAM